MGKEGMGGVDNDVQTKVEQFGINEVLSTETGESALVDGSVGKGGRFSSVSSLFDGRIGLFSRHAKKCSQCRGQGRGVKTFYYCRG